MLTVINANNEQIQRIYDKHVKKRCFSLKYSYDDEDDIGFVSFRTFSGKRVEFQFKNDLPCFVSFYNNGSTRYDIAYPKGDLFHRLKEIGLRAQEKWKKGLDI
jgi:hypothetical protein